MAHGLNTVIKSEIECNSKPPRSLPPQELGRHQVASKMGSRRIFTPQFKLQVLESYRNDSDCKGNQRATARKYGIHRRQIQKWLQVEDNLRSVVANSASHQHHHSAAKMGYNNNNNTVSSAEMKMSLDAARHRVVLGSSGSTQHSLLTSTTTLVATRVHKQASSFISPVHSYGCREQAVSFSQTRLFEYDSPSLPSASLSSLPASSQIATHTAPSPSYPRAFQTSPSSGFTPYQPVDPPFVPSLDYYPPYFGAFHQVAPPPPLPESPIDLSVPRRFGSLLCSRTPSPYDAKWVQPPIQVPAPSTPPTDAVDLRKRKLDSNDEDEAISCSPPPPKQVKLFKPYLLEKPAKEDTVKKNFDDDDFKGRQRDAIIWNNHCTFEYCTPPYPVSPFEVPSSTSYWVPQASPVSGYDSSSSIYSDSESSGGAAHCSIDLKVHAIDSFYGDSAGRGDEGAVAPKFNVHPRYVENWVKQEHALV